MVTLKIAPTTTVKELRKQFLDQVGGVLKVYDGRKIAPDDVILTSIGSNTGTLTVQPDISVGQFVRKVGTQFRLRVSVFTRDAWVIVLDQIPLSEVGSIPKQAVKEDLRRLISERENTPAFHLSAIKAPSKPKPQAECQKADNVKDPVITTQRIQPLAHTLPYTSLAKTVQADIAEWLRSTLPLFRKEFEMQMHLYHFLKETKHYDAVFLEYGVPKEALTTKKYKSKGKSKDKEEDERERRNTNPWKSMRLDMVVAKEQCYHPIELKFHPHSVLAPLVLFGEPFRKAKLTDDAIKESGLYSFWKDVRRIELVRNRFSGVQSGTAIMLTNYDFFLQPVKPGDEHEEFSVAPGHHGTSKHWQGRYYDDGPEKNKPGFDLESEYDIAPVDVTLKDKESTEVKPFKAYIVEIGDTLISRPEIDEVADELTDNIADVD